MLEQCPATTLEHNAPWQVSEHPGRPARANRLPGWAWGSWRPSLWRLHRVCTCPHPAISPQQFHVWNCWRRLDRGLGRVPTELAWNKHEIPQGFSRLFQGADTEPAHMAPRLSSTAQECRRRRRHCQQLLEPCSGYCTKHSVYQNKKLRGYILTLGALIDT